MPVHHAEDARAGTIASLDHLTVDVPGPQITPREVLLRLPDPDRSLADVRVYQELSRPRDGVQATWADGTWSASLPRPDLAHRPALRMEYAFVVDHADGGQDFILDPHNPRSADGPFGPKSVLELPGYQAPAWLDGPITEGLGATTRTSVPIPRFGSSMPCDIWQPAEVDPATPLPLLVVHDGPEYATYASLTKLLAVAMRDGRLPAMRAALLGPVPDQRNLTYSASAHYSDALAFTVLPWLGRAAPQPDGRRPVLMGASLGALAAVHVLHRHPGKLDGLLLQSGSYFRLRTDPQERDFAHFDRVSRFVGQVLSGERVADPVPIAMTCGAVEENLANNRVMAAGLAGLGHEVSLHVNPDGHTFTAWRDTLDPVLLDLLTAAWAPS